MGPMPLVNNVPMWVSFVLGLINMPKVIFGKFTGVFKPLENSLLEAVRSRLPDRERDIFDSQLAEVNLVQCVTAKSSEIDLFRVSIKGVTLQRKQYFSRDIPEYPLARLRVRMSSSCNCDVTLWIVNGVLFSLDFEIDIRNFRHSKEIDVLEFSLVGPAA